MIFKFRDLREGDKIRIEGELYLITKTQIGNSIKKRVNLIMVKNIERGFKRIMIDKETNLISLSSSLLDAGSLDIDFLVNLVNGIDNDKHKIKGEESFLFGFDMEGNILSTAIDNIRDNLGEKEKIHINALIYEVLRMVINRIQEIYNIELEEGTDYEIFTNCLDSHLSLIKEDFDREKVSKNEEDEIKAIIENFN